MTDRMPTAPRPHIHAHTALRGLAALLVVGYHLRFGANPLLGVEEATRLFERGYLWVDFFFLLSGFVLCYVYAPGGLPDGAATLRFYRARIARVWPLHVLTLAFLVAFSLLTIAYETVTGSPGSAYAPPYEHLPLQLFLVHAWGVLDRTSWNVPSWSISTELFAYLLFPVLLWLLRRGGAGFVAIAVAASAAFYLWIGRTTGDLDITVGVALLRCLAGFVLGMALYRLAPLTDRVNGAPLALAQAASIVLILYCIERVPNDAVLIAPFAALVLLTARDRGPISRALSAGWLRRLGEWSYAIYLTHLPIKIALGFVFERAARALGVDGEVGTRIVWILLVYAVTILVSALVYERFEKPARRALLGQRPRPAAPVPAP